MARIKTNQSVGGPANPSPGVGINSRGSWRPGAHTSKYRVSMQREKLSYSHIALQTSSALFRDENPTTGVAPGLAKRVCRYLASASCFAVTEPRSSELSN